MALEKEVSGVEFFYTLVYTVQACLTSRQRSTGRRWTDPHVDLEKKKRKKFFYSAFWSIAYLPYNNGS